MVRLSEAELVTLAKRLDSAKSARHQNDPVYREHNISAMEQYNYCVVGLAVKYHVLVDEIVEIARNLKGVSNDKGRMGSGGESKG